jgi:hypothetical protein
MTKPNSSALAVVLDRSGSMESIREATIEGFNEFLAGQQAVPGEATLTLVQFDNEYEVRHQAAPLADVPPLTGETYVPRGSTALLDAIGRTINSLGARLAKMPECDRPARVLFTIVTDGLENASQEFTRSQVFDMITHQRETYGWEFMFLAANQDAIATGRQYGIDPGLAASYAASDVSARKMFRMASEKQAFSRRSNSPSVAFSERERGDLLSDEPTDSAPRSPDIRNRRKRSSSSSA